MAKTRTLTCTNCKHQFFQHGPGRSRLTCYNCQKSANTKSSLTSRSKKPKYHVWRDPENKGHWHGPHATCKSHAEAVLFGKELVKRLGGQYKITTEGAMPDKQCSCGAYLNNEDAEYWGECQQCRNKLPIHTAQHGGGKTRSESRYHGDLFDRGEW